MYNFPEQLFATLVHGEGERGPGDLCYDPTVAKRRPFEPMYPLRCNESENVCEGKYIHHGPRKVAKKSPKIILGGLRLLVKFHNCVSIFAHVGFGEFTVPVGYVVVIHKFGILRKHCT